MWGVFLFYFFVAGFFKCPLESTLNCSFIDDLDFVVWNHAKKVHGPQYFPWVCGLCGDWDLSNCCFVKPKDLLHHWRMYHGDIVFAKDMIHKKYGNHHSAFPFLTLPPFM